ncbi:hypothetical protein, partial [Arthrobacter sp.]|uniref:hypothetical protein n=1 Tax=Arthrobacter sp. TaxID=1667 RepID=UPI0026E06C62
MEAVEYIMGLGDYMYQERSHGVRLSPAMLIGLAPTPVLEENMLDRPQREETPAQLLTRIRGLLDLLGIDIETYHMRHSILTHSNASQRAENDAALAWMETSLEDIAATLEGFSTSSPTRT